MNSLNFLDYKMLVLSKIVKNCIKKVGPIEMKIIEIDTNDVTTNVASSEL